MKMEIRNVIKNFVSRIGNVFSGESRSKNGAGALPFSGYIGAVNETQAMRLSAVYACVDVTSKAVAQLPLGIFSIDASGYKKPMKDMRLAYMLGKRPNSRMTRYSLVELWVQSMHLRGNAFAYIKRDDNGEATELIYLPPSYVTVVPPLSINEPVKYNVQGIGAVKPADIIHIVNKSFDGVNGLSTIYFAANTLGLSRDAEKHARNFFASGCGTGGILKSKKVLTDKQITDTKKAWKQTVGNEGSNGVVVLGADLDFTRLTVNPTDAQLLETRQFNVIDICRFFGVSPVKVFDLTKSSYNTVEATNISFLTDTVQPMLEKIELELETKLFPGDPSVDIRFDVNQLLRADKRNLAAYFSTLYQIGAINSNEIRREIDLPPIPGGDRNYVQVNLTPLDGPKPKE